jgi:hypothetical protein
VAHLLNELKNSCSAIQLAQFYAVRQGLWQVELDICTRSIMDAQWLLAAERPLETPMPNHESRVRGMVPASRLA